jgi:hypothetical protein
MNPKFREWTTEEIRVILDRSISDDEMAVMMGRTKRAIAQKRYLESGGQLKKDKYRRDVKSGHRLTEKDYYGF